MVLNYPMLSAHDVPHLSFEEAKAMDGAMIGLGLSISELMAVAGFQLAQHIRQLMVGSSILMVCGKGHNAGDALVAARLLSLFGYDVSCFLVSEDVHEAVRVQYQALRAFDVAFVDKMSLGGVDLVVDAIFGVGLTGSPRSDYAACIDAMNQGDVPILSVDVPSGIGTDVAVFPNTTLTFGYPKTVFKDHHGACGHIVACDIGIPRTWPPEKMAILPYPFVKLVYSSF
tara:strand:- start:2728 stop:3411 length:684 start_codon:yes stop_codon:yes gene_type:complete